MAIGFGAATVFAIVSALLLKGGRSVTGSPISWPRAFAGTADWYVWALLVPVVVYLARRYPVDRRWGLGLAVHGVLALAVALVELAVFAVISLWYNQSVLGTPFPDFGYAYLNIVAQWLPVALLIYGLIVALVTAVDRSRRARDREVAAARLGTDLARARLHALQAQIQPHFLFNALNTVSNLVRSSDRADAVEAMAALGRLLRRVMELSGDTETTLARELDFVRDYLELERYRMEERLEVVYRIEPGVAEARVPAMVLQPIVENAVRHGIAPLAGGGMITVKAQRRGGRLEVTIGDDGAGFEDAEEGVGLGNVRDRLRAHYGEAGELMVRSASGRGTRVRVRIPAPVTEADDT